MREMGATPEWHNRYAESLIAAPPTDIFREVHGLNAFIHSIAHISGQPDERTDELTPTAVVAAVDSGSKRRRCPRSIIASRSERASARP